MKKQKYRLSELRVSSFVSSAMPQSSLGTVKGGEKIIVTPPPSSTISYDHEPVYE